MGYSLTIEITPIKGKMIDESVLGKYLFEAVQKELTEIDREFEQTVNTWNGKPGFKKEVVPHPDRIQGTVSTDNKIYGYINNGTSVRRALMSKNWKSKTKPGFIGSGQGAGHVVFISRRISRPGIKARNFDKVIARRVQKRFLDRVNEAYAKGIKDIYK